MMEKAFVVGSRENSAAPPSFEAKYEGGMFGYSSKEPGTLRFDDDNLRLVFYGSDKKEKFSINYDDLVVIYPQSKSVTSTTGTVVSHIPLPGAGLGSYIKEKRQYLVVRFKDPDADVEGLVNFKIDNNELLDSVIGGARAYGHRCSSEAMHTTGPEREA